MFKLRQIARQLAGTDGAEVAEAALVLPMVFTLLLGIIWFGRAYNIYSTITQAAQQGAITAARSSCGTCGNNAATAAAVDNAVYSVLRNSSIDPTQILVSPKPTQPPCISPPGPPGGACKSTGNNVWVCQNVQINFTAGSPEPQQCGSVVSLQYPFQFFLPFTSLNLQQITLSAQAQSRMEN